MGKTMIDSAVFAVGGSEKLQGTGVWSFIKLERNKDGKEEKASPTKDKKVSRDVRSNAFVNQEARTLYDNRVVPFERPTLTSMRGARLGSGPVFKLSAGEPCESNLADVS